MVRYSITIELMRKIGFFGDTDFIMLQKMDKKGKAKPI